MPYQGDSKYAIAALIREARRRKAQKDILFFANYYLGHLLESEMPDFHKEIYSLLFQEKRLAIAAPRGFAKSTIVQIVYVLHCLLYNWGEDIMTISASASLAEEWIRKVKNELDNNQRINEDFGKILEWGEGVSKKWTQDHITLHRSGEFWSQLRARGRGCQVRGFRPTKVICDDLEDEQLVRSEQQRTELKQWFLSALTNVLSINQQLIFIGTILHPLSLLAQILERKDEFESWCTRKYKALSEDGKSLWEARYSAEWLLQKKREIGSYAFEQEFQNNPISQDIVLFRGDWLKCWENLPRIERKFMGIDPAISTKDTADYTGIVIWGEGEDGKIYEIESVKGRWGTWDLAEKIILLYQKHQPFRIGVEIVAFQQILKDVLLKVARERGIRLPIQSITLGKYKQGVKRAAKDKVSRAMSVIHLFEQDEVRLIRDGKLYEQLMVFPTGSEDDLVDAAVHGLYTMLKFGRNSKVFHEELPKPQPESFEVQDNKIPCLSSIEEVLQGGVKDWRL